MERTPRQWRRLAVAAVAIAVAMASAGCTGLPFADSAGSKARDLVSSATYTKLIVEIDWLVQGGTSYQPSSVVTQFLLTRLQERLSKPGGITIELSDAIEAEKPSYSTSDLAEVESKFRRHRSGGDTAAVWVLFATVSSDSTSGGFVAGIAYAGTSCAVFSKSIEDASTIFVTADSVERVVVVHEFGHLMGLVNLGTPMVSPHEDPAHPHHSSNENSVMYWQVEGGGIIDLMRGGGSPDNFDADDIADLRAIGGK